MVFGAVQCLDEAIVGLPPPLGRIIGGGFPVFSLAAVGRGRRLPTRLALLQCVQG